jgi:hypothetical protein
MRTILAMAALVVAGVGLAAQVSQPANKAARGHGAMTCAAFNAATARTGPDANQVSWTLGYLAALESSGAKMRAVSDSYVRGWVGSYCESHDTATISAAAEALVTTLKN